MSIVLLLLVVMTDQLENMAVRLYGRKHQDGGMFFNAIICAFAALFLLITDKNGLQFPKELFLYSISGAVTTAVGFYTAYLAFKYGSFILTKLISSFYSVIVIAYGIVFLREPADLFGYIGIVLFLISSVMVNLKKEDVSEKKEFSVKWLVCAVLCAVGNALLVIIMRSQQIKFDGAYDNEYMIVNSLGAAILLFAIGLITERKNVLGIVKKGFVYGAVTGGINGLKNLLTLIVYLYIPLSIFTPARAGVGCVLGFIISVLLYKEKFTKAQLIGIFLGALSVVLFAM